MQMKIGRTLLVLGVVAGAGCLELYARRRRSRGFARQSEREKGTLRSFARSALRSRGRDMLPALAALPELVGRYRKRDAFRLQGKAVLITGGSRGFGLALAEEFAGRGAKLILTARDAEELERARKQLLRLGFPGEDVRTIACDLTDREQTKTMVEAATREFGQIDILVNNAGIISVGPVENQPVEAFKSAIESNYYTMLHATLAVLPQMLERRSGNIVNIASIGGKVAAPHLLPYSASKFAALGFSQGLHAELRAKGICVTSVCPGLMRTGSHTQALFSGDKEREYRWFSLVASLPGVSVSARAAARKVARATADGRTEISITPQAIVFGTLAQALPELTATAMRWTNSILLPQPVADPGASMVPGREVRGQELTGLMGWGRNAAQRYNES